jgi:uncharacterized protein (UPF0262 family)
MAGRPKKAETTAKTENKTDDQSELIKSLMEQVASLTETVKKQETEKTDMKALIDALKSNSGEPVKKKDIPNKVKVISLVPNQYNLSTQEDGTGKVFSFPKFGHTITMRTSDLEDVLSIEKYRTQAEKGYIYICDADVVEEVGLTEEYKDILDDKAMSHVLNLVDDNAVDMFCALDSDMKESIAIHIAENLANNKPVDRNRLFNIKLKTNIDIEKMAEDLKSARDKLNN